MFFFPIPVYGNYYVSQFLNYCLPSLLTDGNFPYIAKQGKVVIVITTTERDKIEIINNNNYKKLQDIAEVVIDITDKINSAVMSDCHNKAFELCSDGYVFFILADHVLPNDGLRVLYKNMQNNTEAIQVIAPRIKQSAIRNKIEEFRQESGIISITQEELNRISFGNLDHTMYWRDIDGEMFTDWPSSLMQKDKHAICFRFFHLHLMVLKVKSKVHIDSSHTFDARFVSNVVSDINNVLTIDNCSEFFMPSTVPDLFLIPTDKAHSDKPIFNFRKSSLVETADWARKIADEFEWNNFKNYKIILGDANYSGVDKLLDSNTVNQVVEMAKLLNYFEKADCVLADNHNMQGLSVDNLIVDNIEDKSILSSIDSSKKLFSINGLENIFGRKVSPLLDLENYDELKDGIFLYMNHQSLQYLKKLLTLGVPVEYIYTSIRMDSINECQLSSNQSFTSQRSDVCQVARKNIVSRIVAKIKRIAFSYSYFIARRIFGFLRRYFVA